MEGSGVGSFISTHRKDDRWVETERPGCRKRKRSTPGTKFHLGSCRGWIARMSRYEYSEVDIALAYVPCRLFSSCISQCYEPQAKNKPARKRALMDETSFQPHGALLLPPYFPPLSSTLLRLRRSLRWFTLKKHWSRRPIHFELHPTIGLLKFMRVYSTSPTMQGENRDRRKNRRNKILTSFGCEMGIPRTVIEPCREWKPPDNGIPWDSREKPHGPDRKHIGREIHMHPREYWYADIDCNILFAEGCVR